MTLPSRPDSSPKKKEKKDKPGERRQTDTKWWINRRDDGWYISETIEGADLFGPYDVYEQAAEKRRSLQ